MQTALGNLGKWVRPGGTALDHFPLLTWVPRFLNPWKRIGLDLHREELSLFLGQYVKARKRAETGNIQTCFSTKLQERQAKFDMNDAEVRDEVISDAGRANADGLLCRQRTWLDRCLERAVIRRRLH